MLPPATFASISFQLRPPSVDFKNEVDEDVGLSDGVTSSMARYPTDFVGKWNFHPKPVGTVMPVGVKSVQVFPLSKLRS